MTDWLMNHDGHRSNAITSERIAVYCLVEKNHLWQLHLNSNCHVNIATNPVISHEWPRSVYDKWNISVAICDTYIL
jgi:hypothetical protein